ncbi:ABC-type taurine transport system [Commensalibacter communis]|uniref:Periplasmic component (TauA) n=1 Tax=Commensalibacter communis TaxID=2972786 RepID=A0A9W4TQI2_9PROT|nr:ABC transporter substrate-binding protein [Commensalibacter communis]CAI3951673.1 ABC-type taurine transport system [Commensalibacter communis]CAI3957279.1 ABC-type taurine transport system [Commensalibacter communis]CAI3957988.1 ABC-type taurine transport system [Commensalibacter communis]CAI3959351.1 ABC-type taurine transport system [Commensalibacter communis]
MASLGISNESLHIRIPQLFLKSSLTHIKSYILCVLALLVVSICCIFDQTAHAAISIGWTNQVDLAKIAQVNGAYRKALGERIYWKQYDDDFQMLHDLAIEKIDFAPVGLIALTSAVTAGLQVRIIAISSQYGTGSGLVLRNQSHIDKPEFLVGKKIAVPFLTSAHYSLLKALEHWKIDFHQVQLINMPADKIEDAWKKGDIDGAYVDGITLLHFQKDGHVLVTSQQLADWGNPTYVFWVTMDNKIAEKPYSVEPFVNTTLSMIKGFNQRKDQLTPQSKDVVDVSKLLKISPEETLTLLKGNLYIGQREQSLIFERRLPVYLGNVALFLRSLNVMNNVLSDYLIYIYPSFVDDAKIK